MKSLLVVFSGFLLMGGSVVASTIDDNPFLKPSERIILTEEEKNPELNEDCHEFNDACREAMLNSLMVELEREAVLKLPAHLQPEVLGKWTRNQVEESEYKGETNGIKIYYNNKLKQYIYLDLSKAKSKG
ncbi:hypothetical protein [Psychromonas sp. SP041]|uniref:hypothetical protein n=1 Tax=Psychromonas sp. SP041 TaxID=1365007 RepID=UPI000416B6BA|nr:hypothetical protein [Psychromonas sp. SP041]